MSTTPPTHTHLLRRDQKVSDLTLERYLLGELSHEEMTFVEDILKKSSETNQRLNAMKQVNVSLRQIIKPPQATPSSNESRGWSWMLNPWVLTAALVLTLYVLTPRFFSSNHQSNLHTAYNPLNPYGQTRTKGATITWETYLTPSQKDPKLSSTAPSRLLNSGDVIHPQQKVAFRAYPKKDGHYMIIGQDQSQEWYLVAPYTPNQDTQSTQLLHKPQTPTTFIDLNEALEFDDKLGTEKLFFLFCAKTSTYQKLKAFLTTYQVSLSHKSSTQKSATKTPKLPNPSQCQVSTLLLQKEK